MPYPTGHREQVRSRIVESAKPTERATIAEMPGLL
jgi:hypothetical protein